MGDESHVAFGQKFPGEKGSVKQCVVVMQQPVLLLPKFSEFFVKNALDVKENNEHALDSAFHLSRIFRPRRV
jgi:hypothetical protein